MNWNKYLTITAVFLTVIGLSFSFMVWEVNEMAESDCYDTLQDEMRNLAESIEKNIAADREQLEVVADILSGYDELDSKGVRNILKSYETRSVISRICILFPNDTTLLKDGSLVNAEGVLSFEQEAEHGTHISGRTKDLLEGEEVLRHFVPIVKDGKTTGILYGVMEPKRLPEFWTSSAFGGGANVYIIERETGDILMNTCHGELGHIGEENSFHLEESPEKKQLEEDIIEGKEGYMILSSESGGELMHFYHAPLAVNQWTLAISVEESAVFKNATEIKDLLYGFAGFVAVSFVIYFIGLLWYMRSEANARQRQLEMVKYIYNVEKTLFEAYQTGDNTELALGQIAERTTAEAAFFKIFDAQAKGKMYLWCQQEEKKAEFSAILEKYQYFRDYFSGEKKPLLLYSAKDGKVEGNGKYEAVGRGGLSGIMAVEVKGVDGNVVGVLGALNMKQRWKSTELLENVALSFAMFFNNMCSFNIIKEMGETDLLTGLLNRNSYQKKLTDYPKNYTSSLACIYADANGLHELNNSQGHEAGDRMLQSVARLMQERFGVKDTYRIGGDEFVAFAVDQPEADTLQKVAEMSKMLGTMGYHISVGVNWEQEVADIDSLVKKAEQEMYAAKRRYYEQNGRDRRSRR